MKLINILECLGISTKEIRSKFALKQLAINGKLCTALDTDIKLASETEIGYTDLDEFLFNLSVTSIDDDIASETKRLRRDVPNLCDIFKPENTFNISKKLSLFISGFICISISKTENYVFMRK